MSRACRLRFAFTGALVLCVPESSHAQFVGDQQRQAQCELSAIGTTRSPLAIDWIRTACNRLAIDANSLLNESNRQFYLCLVQNLSGAQSDAAANRVIGACRTAYPP